MWERYCFRELVAARREYYHAFPQLTSAKREYAGAVRDLATLEEKSGNYDQVIPMFEEAVALTDEVAIESEKDPVRLDTFAPKANSALFRQGLAVLMMKTGRLGEAELLLCESLTRLEELSVKYPNNPPKQKWLKLFRVKSSYLLGLTQLQTAPELANESFSRALQNATRYDKLRTLARLHQREKATNPLADSKSKIGNATVFAACAWSAREMGMQQEYELYRDKAIELLMTASSLSPSEVRDHVDLQFLNEDPIYQEKVFARFPQQEIAH